MTSQVELQISVTIVNGSTTRAWMRGGSGAPLAAAVTAPLSSWRGRHSAASARASASTSASGWLHETTKRASPGPQS